MDKRVKKVSQYLKERNVEFQLFHHDEAFTAMEIADAQGVPGKQMVKSVIIRNGDGYVMCVLPAIHLIDFEMLKESLGTDDLTLASEREVGELFPECEVGAEPPFGGSRGLPIYCDSLLLEDEEIVFNAGTHTDTVKIRFRDYQRIAHPQMVNMGVHI